VIEQRAVGDADALSDLGDRLHLGFAGNLNIGLDTHDLNLPSCGLAQTFEEHQVLGLSKMAPVFRFAVLIHSPASIFLPSPGWTRVTLKRPSAQTTVKPSASSGTISPSLPPMPLGSLA